MKNKANNLIKEKSPYLLQHAYNPVDWYPWAEEAFAKAIKEDKPIFLSVGYSTCHWCHVMEEESFNDPEVARLLNDTFICIKVDREERPDIDATYMAACQAMTGAGGWPLTIIMTPDKKPFFAGTYFPKHAKFGQIGLLQLIPRIKDAWEKNREVLLRSADAVLDMLEEHHEKGEINPVLLTTAYKQLAQRFDEEYGGFDGAPKFPSPCTLLFLLRYWKKTKETHALEMVEKTLQHMARGGIYDHIGFGFHRYATDQRWMIPHFEKMLYDQALLVMVYCEAYLTTKKEEYQWIAQEIVTYVLRDLTHKEGGFFCGEDADSEGQEGKFYAWTKEEIEVVLGKDADAFFQAYGLEDFEGSGVLYKKESGMKEEWREKLFAVREKRVHPFKDDKILTDWNGLMIAALAKCGSAFDEEKYVLAAEKGAGFILQRLIKNNQLLHRYREGEASIPAFLDDYAFFIWGLLELYEATFKEKYLRQAIALQKEMIQLFWDNKDGGFFATREVILTKRTELYDGVIPSGNAVAVMNMLRIYAMSGQKELKEYAQKMCTAFAGTLAQAPSTYTFFMQGIDLLFGPVYTLVTGNEKIVKELQKNFLPKTMILWLDESCNLPLLKDKKDKTIAYLCKEGTCLLPTSDMSKIVEQIN